MMNDSNMVVFATDNRHTKERVYSYYTVGEFVYQEPDLHSGSTAVGLVAGTGNTDPGKTTIVDEVFGAA